MLQIRLNEAQDRLRSLLETIDRYTLTLEQHGLPRQTLPLQQRVDQIGQLCPKLAGEELQWIADQLVVALQEEPDARQHLATLTGQNGIRQPSLEEGLHVPKTGLVTRSRQLAVGCGIVALLALVSLGLTASGRVKQIPLTVAVGLTLGALSATVYFWLSFQGAAWLEREANLNSLLKCYMAQDRRRIAQETLDRHLSTFTAQGLVLQRDRPTQDQLATLAARRPQIAPEHLEVFTQLETAVREEPEILREFIDAGAGAIRLLPALQREPKTAEIQARIEGLQGILFQKGEVEHRASFIAPSAAT